MYQTSFLSNLPIDPLDEGHMSLTAKSISAKLTDQDILLLKRHVLVTKVHVLSRTAPIWMIAPHDRLFT